MEDIKGLLPIGSVVTLKEGTKKLMIIGVKQTDLDTSKEYDYLSLIYPEGFLNASAMFFFNSEAIERIHYIGYSDKERTEFLNKLESFYNNR